MKLRALAPVLVVAGCAASPKPLATPALVSPKDEAAPPSTDAAPAPPSLPQQAAPKSAGPEPMPSACDSTGDTCTPPRGWVKKLCGGHHPGVALAMFSKGTPWTRGYLTRNTKAWNASGGESSDADLAFDEEVIVVASRAPDTGGMTVSGAGAGYDVLRWDGTCASLSGEELTKRPPPKAKAAKIEWKALDDGIKQALSADAKIGPLDQARRKECRGATMGEVSDKCVKADMALAAAVVDFVRRGGALPLPEKRP